VERDDGPPTAAEGARRRRRRKRPAKPPSPLISVDLEPSAAPESQATSAQPAPARPAPASPGPARPAPDKPVQARPAPAHPPAADGPAAIAAVRRALATLAQAARALATQAGAPPPDRLTFELAVAVTPPGNAAAEAFLQAARDAAEGARPPDTIWRDGAVYCFQCGAPDCRHAEASSVDAVFAGYAPTGKPEWRGFVETCVAQRLSGVERLFDRPPGVVAYVQREALTAELLPGFGRDSVTYTVLGQAVVGLLPPSWAGDAGERAALSVLVVQVHRPGEPLSLRVNLLGLPSEAVLVAAADSAPRGPAERLRRLLSRLRAQLESLARRAGHEADRGAVFDVAPAVGSLLGHLRGDLVRVFEPDERRTRHAEDRHQGGERPTDTVWRDARHAGDERLFWDAHRETVVVAGPRGRAHVFTAAALHVTSLRLEPGELERKLAQGRWRALPPERLAPFRTAMIAAAARPAGVAAGSSAAGSSAAGPVAARSAAASSGAASSGAASSKQVRAQQNSGAENSAGATSGAAPAPRGRRR
jgi:hypothetical protein